MPLAGRLLRRTLTVLAAAAPVLALALVAQVPPAAAAVTRTVTFTGSVKLGPLNVPVSITDLSVSPRATGLPAAGGAVRVVNKSGTTGTAQVPELGRSVRLANGKSAVFSLPASSSPAARVFHVKLVSLGLPLLGSAAAPTGTVTVAGKPAPPPARPPASGGGSAGGSSGGSTGGGTAAPPPTTTRPGGTTTAPRSGGGVPAPRTALPGAAPPGDPGFVPGGAGLANSPLLSAGSITAGGIPGGPTAGGVPPPFVAPNATGPTGAGATTARGAAERRLSNRALPTSPVDPTLPGLLVLVAAVLAAGAGTAVLRTLYASRTGRAAGA